MSSLRKRLEKSPALAKAVGGVMGLYLRFCVATSRWEHHGVDALCSDLANGSVLCMSWHGRLLMIGPHWPREAGSLSCLHDTSPIARAAGALQKYFGLDPFEMSARRSNLTTSREIMKRARSGTSIGITADGPIGPKYKIKDAPIEWARTLQRPIYGYAFATKRRITMKTWDEMVLPLPFSRGVWVFRRIDASVPRKATKAEIATARTVLEDGLNAITAEAESLIR